MIKEPKNIDFYTTGKQPTKRDFKCISEWIKNDKKRKNSKNGINQLIKPKDLA